MSKEEFLKIQTCVLKVNIHCDGCKHKVKKILHKIEGVYTTKIDSEQGKVTVSGNVDSDTLIKKLNKKGKHAELWGGAPKQPNNNNNLNLNLGGKDQLKNLQIGKGGAGNSNKPQGPNNHLQPKGLAGAPPHGPTPQQMKSFQDMKMPPQFMKMMPQIGGANNNNINKGQISNQKGGGGGGKPPLALPEDDDMSDDDDYDDDDFDDDDDYDDEEDEDDDELDGPPMNKPLVKPGMMGNGLGPQMPGMSMKGPQMPGMSMKGPQMPGMSMKGPQMPGMSMKGPQMPNMSMKGPQMPNMLMKGPQMPGNGGKNVPIQMNQGGGGKKGGNNGGNQNVGAGKGGKSGGPDGKSGGGNGSQDKIGGGGGDMHNMMMKKGGGMNGGGASLGMPNMMNGGGGQMMPMSHMGQMGNQGAIQGINGGPEQMAGNPYYQQQMAAMMMNQQRANGNERFQPMMYARPPPAVNYMQPYPPYPYPPPPGERADQYSMFSDENTSSCSVM